jgi:hypothetical protein
MASPWFSFKLGRTSVGAVSNSLYGGGAITNSTIDVQFNKEGLYQLCLSTRTTARRDHDFALVAGVYLRVLLPDNSIDTSNDNYNTSSDITAMFASVSMLAACCLACCCGALRRRRHRLPLQSWIKVATQAIAEEFVDELGLIHPYADWGSVVTTKGCLEDLRQNPGIRQRVPLVDQLVATTEQRVCALQQSTSPRVVKLIALLTENELAAIVAYTHELQLPNQIKSGNLYFELNNALRIRSDTGRNTTMRTWGTFSCFTSSQVCGAYQTFSRDSKTRLVK